MISPAKIWERSQIVSGGSDKEVSIVEQDMGVFGSFQHKLSLSWQIKESITGRSTQFAKGSK